jgi:hypothetical protein
MRTSKSQTELRHKLTWYVENYGLCLSTVRRNRKLLDTPLKLLNHLLYSRGPTPHIGKLSNFIDGDERQ